MIISAGAESAVVVASVVDSPSSDVSCVVGLAPGTAQDQMNRTEMLRIIAPRMESSFIEYLQFRIHLG
jgi:tripartite-type tricarboxylate transporter receptor subunit TctC